MLTLISRLNINKVKPVGNNIFRGPTLEKKPDCLKILKEFGIDTVVDFRRESSTLPFECREVGLKYIKFPLDHILLRKKSKAKPDIKITDRFIQEMKNFFNIMNKGNAYVGCQYGIERTNIGLTYNYFLNTKYPLDNPPTLLTWGNNDNEKHIINVLSRIIKKTFKQLTQNQKNILEIKDDFQNYFDNNIKVRIGKLIAQNKGK